MTQNEKLLFLTTVVPAVNRDHNREQIIAESTFLQERLAPCLVLCGRTDTLQSESLHASVLSQCW